MDKFFELGQDNIVTITPQVLALEPIAKIWERDKTKSKKKAFKELTFIWGMCTRSEDNIWRNYLDEATRGSVIKADVFGKDSKWEVDKQIVEAIHFYRKKFPKTVIDKMLESVEISLNNLSDYIRNVDYTEKNDNGTLVNDAKKIASIIKDLAGLHAGHKELEAAVLANKEKEDSTIRGGGQIGLFEEANSFSKLN